MTTTPLEGAPAEAHALPVAGPADVRRAAARLIRQDRRSFAGVVALNSAAALAGLAAPWLLGRIVDEVRAGAGVAVVDRLALAIVAAAVVQLLLSRWARYAAHRMGERTLARVRETFVDRCLALPASVVERAGTGDLATRGTADVAAVGTTLRDSGPQIVIASAQLLFLLGAAVATDPLLGGCALTGLVAAHLATRWYLRRAPAAYLAQGAADSGVAEILSATSTGARTVEAFRLGDARLRAGREALTVARAARMRTLLLRNVYFPAVEIAYSLPLITVLLVGGWLHLRGAVTLGTVLTAAFYMRQIEAPLDEVLSHVDQLQSGGASFARVEGLARAPMSNGEELSTEPEGDRIEVRGARYAYPGGPEVLGGVDLVVRPGERLAVVGPSGAGKTTLSRLVAGIDAPTAGSVTVGGVPVVSLAPERLRRQVVLVTQEHHVFLGTVRDNLLIAEPEASDAELWAALRSVGAEWVSALPDGLDTVLGGDAYRASGPQAQQLALARVVLADPHTLVLDEATALLDPATARHAERALAAVLEGRTVIAIAHRLHTAHDADRVAVMRDGRLTELGPHDELVAAGGEYASLWRTWHGTPIP
ncbi:ABC transporter ATP-binding protein [Streptomyces sp. NPDC005012]|uniref:ABC transporter ATP-binding protein n=1 Tax=Streptomyces sp. NPDC005012 TaxID=3154558 RepID=UPI0033B0A0F4